ncbi:MAG: prepilin-type N-terminal cleavage/methylation domain-containing protein [Desulfobacterales bacterium]|nr:prepilin-type N-terminal cleavage/methylation domain-containing protein [Desulfobacterales bacterium]MBF0396703.1 prepilin-type N-terminal cleavage/methylation domain-containing protein [Desulfobacterales bacterium]
MSKPIDLLKKNIKTYGFTLIEIVIATFLLSIIVTTIFGSYRVVFSNVDIIEKGIDYREMGQNCLNRMLADFNSLYVLMPPLYKPPDFNAEPSPYRFVGEVSHIGNNNFPKIRFASFAHVPLSEEKKGGIAEIVYYVSEVEDGKYVLRRSDKLEPFEPFQEKKSDPIICEEIKSFNVKYFGQDGKEQDDWDSETYNFEYTTPVSVSIKLEIGTDFIPFSIETIIMLPIYREKVAKTE